jgi:hypothetical protein
MSLVRIFKQFGHAYEQLATSFSTHSVEDIDKAIEANAELFTKDANLGTLARLYDCFIEFSSSVYVFACLQIQF